MLASPHHLGPVRRIAVFRALALGDLMLSVPAFRALRRRFPDAEISYLGLPWSRALMRRFTAYVDRVVEFAGYPGIDEVPYDSQRTERFLAEQQAYDYDVVIQMHGSGQASNPFALALGGRITVGHYVDTPLAGLTLGRVWREEHESVRALALVGMLGADTSDVSLEFPILPDERLEAAQLMQPLAARGGLWLGMHPGASVASRRWPPHYFASVADHFAYHYGAQIVLTGGPDEREIALAVAAHMAARPLDLSGQTSLGGLAAVIDSLDLFLTNDTGPSHIGYALGTPSVTVFGPVHPARWEPLGPGDHTVLYQPVGCNPCGLTECPIDHRCLRWIHPETVIEALETLLARRQVA
ncbi:MAG: glycosyltransferase family 9 protein [Anaerolineae bacterium]